MTWLLLNIPLMVLFFALWAGIPLWLVRKRPDPKPDLAAALAAPACRRGGTRGRCLPPRRVEQTAASLPLDVRGCRDAGVQHRVHGGRARVAVPGRRARRVLADQPVAPPPRGLIRLAPAQRPRAGLGRDRVAGRGGRHPGPQ